jgi:pimeloyl-ACP methyl ester carboxylesterase
MRTTLLLAAFIVFSSALFSQHNTPLFFRMQEHRTKKHSQRHLDYNKLVVTSSASIHVQYNDKPGKPYLLLLHGMGIDAKTNWYRQIEPLSLSYNLILPDLIFFGESNSDEKNYSVEFQIEQIRECLQKLNLPTRLNVMGYSYGGLAAAVYNELYPEEVIKLIIISAPVKFYSTPMADSLAAVQGMKRMSQLIVPQNVKEFNAMQEAVVSRKFLVSKKFKKKMIAQYFESVVDVRRLQIGYLDDFATHYQNLNYNLDKTNALLIWGAKDGVVPLSVGKALHAHFNNTTTLKVFEKAKHDSHFRYAKRLNNEVVKFLRK